jgi:glycosyltransferase involved in cell wall biosynthesis
MITALFICGGNRYNGNCSQIVLSQGESLKNNGIRVKYFPIVGKGILGYLKNILPLIKFVKNNNIDIVHSHYAYSGILATFATRLPIVVSLMGSDLYSKKISRAFIRLFCRLSWKAVIVKSEKMYQHLKIRTAYIIPNGVDFNLFREISKENAKRRVKFNDKQHIVFLTKDSQQKEKNYSLAQEAYSRLNTNSVELNLVENVSFSEVPYYINASDVILLTSLWEGSPNIIKEAMACNCPIVSTDVGDVKKNVGDTNGCYVASFNAQDIADKIQLALEFGQRTCGRNNIKHLEINYIAKKIIKIYQNMLKKN